MLGFFSGIILYCISLKFVLFGDTGIVGNWGDVFLCSLEPVRNGEASWNELLSLQPATLLCGLGAPYYRSGVMHCNRWRAAELLHNLILTIHSTFIAGRHGVMLMH